MKKPGLFAVIRSRMRLMRLSYSTEKTYIFWIKYFIKFHRDKHPREMGANEITLFLSHLAEKKNVSASVSYMELECA